MEDSSRTIVIVGLLSGWLGFLRRGGGGNRGKGVYLGEDLGVERREPLPRIYIELGWQLSDVD